MPSYIIQSINAGNGVNGNPRRAFVVYDALSGHWMDAYDEGYHGTRAVPRETWDAAVYIGEIRTTVQTYRDTLRRANLGTVR